MFAEALAAIGRIDIVVNNAGTIRRAPAVDTTTTTGTTVLEVEPLERLPLCRAAGQHMLDARRAARSSTSRRCSRFRAASPCRPTPRRRAASPGSTKALANEWAARGINVNAIAPGYMRTENTRCALEPRRAIGKFSSASPPVAGASPPTSPARSCSWLGRADYVNGHVLVVDGGWMGR